MNLIKIKVPYDTRELERAAYVAYPAEIGYVKETFLAEIPEWVRIGQLKENEVFWERDY